MRGGQSDLSRLAGITYDYVLNMFKVGHPVAAPRDMELSEEEQENFVFLLGSSSNVLGD